MIKRLHKTDYLFIIALFCGLLFHLSLIWIPHLLFDETFYATIPYRLINGDSLVQHEWHLTQFSSVFLYFPVRLWTLIKGSTDGIYLFLRFLYIFVHTVVTGIIYKFFRSYGKTAIIAAIMYYLLIPYKIYSLSYTSMFAIFFLLFVLSLFSIYQNHSVKSYILAGFFFGSFCVNNPIFCVFFIFYLILCALWQKNEILISLLCKEFYLSRISKKKLNRAKKKSFEAILTKSLQKKELLSQAFKSYDCFFNKNALKYSFIGICIIAAISVMFFFFTGGTISSIFENIENLLQSSEYFTTSKGTFIQKSFDFKKAVNFISLDMPYLLPIFFSVLALDRSRKKNSHRIIYLTVCLLLTSLFAVGIIKAEENIAHFFSLPFALFSTLCYILTNKKQSSLFFCIWIPCAAASLICLYSSNTFFYSSSYIFSISNIVGVFFAYDLLKEMLDENKNHSGNKLFKISSQSIIVAAICFQLFFSCFTTQEHLARKKDQTIQATTGPLQGMFFNENEYNTYINNLKGMDYIKKISNSTDPVLIAGNLNWIYMYLERPVGTYTAYYLGLEKDALSEYYKKNPEKLPKYIYIMPVETNEYKQSAEDIFEEEIDTINSMFTYTKENLYDSILLNVTDYIYQQETNSK